MISQNIEIDADSVLKIVKLYVEETTGTKITSITVNIKGKPLFPLELSEMYQFKIVAQKIDGVTRKAMKGVVAEAHERKITPDL